MGRSHAIESLHNLKSGTMTPELIFCKQGDGWGKGWLDIHRWLRNSGFAIACWGLPESSSGNTNQSLLSSKPTKLRDSRRAYFLMEMYTGFLLWRRYPTCHSFLHPQKFHYSSRLPNFHVYIFPHFLAWVYLTRKPGFLLLPAHQVHQYEMG